MAMCLTCVCEERRQVIRLAAKVDLEGGGWDVTSAKPHAYWCTSAAGCPVRAHSLAWFG